MPSERNPGAPPSETTGDAPDDAPRVSTVDTPSTIEPQPRDIIDAAVGGIPTTSRDDEVDASDEARAVHALMKSPTPALESGPRGPRGGTGASTSTAPLPPKSTPPHLLPQDTTTSPKQALAVKRKASQERRLERMREIDSQVQLRAAEIVRSYVLSASIDDEGQPVDGQRWPAWGRKQVAKDGRLSKKQQPGYLADAVRICEWRSRKEAGQDRPAPVLNVGTVYVQNNVSYPVIDDEE